ncbi:hypothetical protein VUG52_13575 [Pseudomonas sp. LH21]|uniref:hypothetical protein n=1 Tax=Pseudomonas sp. LH21 TaxID=3114884 RepID=UPI002F947005
MKKRLTKTEVEKLAIRYARLFHGPTVSGGPKTREYWRAMFLFGCLAICAVIGVFVTALWPEYTLIPGLAALCLEGWALLLWVRTYEPQFREHVLRKEGVLRFSDAQDGRLQVHLACCKYPGRLGFLPGNCREPSKGKGVEWKLAAVDSIKG